METEPNPSAAHNLPPWKPNSRIKLKWLITQDSKETIWQRIICAWLEIKADDSQIEVHHKNKLFHMPRGWYILPVSQIFLQPTELQVATSLTFTSNNNLKQIQQQQNSEATSHTCDTLLKILIYSFTEECSAFYRFHPSLVNCRLYPTRAAGVLLLIPQEEENQTWQVTSPSHRTHTHRNTSTHTCAHAHLLSHSNSGVIRSLKLNWCKFLVCGRNWKRVTVSDQ